MADSSTNNTIQSSSNSTQNGSPRRGVIVSSNRFYDLEPFCCYLFKAQPQKWGAVFPWDFPQHAGKDDEEDFIRKQFDPVMVHVQGYRFLKQVFYSCALWNLHQRVPLVEQWFWDQPANKELLDDPETQKYFLNEDAKPSTFFQQPELDLYGHRFLSVVIKAIQNTARAHLSTKEDRNRRNESLSIDVTPRKRVSATGDDLPIKSAPPARQEHAIEVQRENLVSNRRSTLAARERPHFPQTPISNIPTVTENTNIYQSPAPAPAPVLPPKDKPPKFRKRGNSYTQRFNQRGDHFQPFQYQHFANRDHSMQPLSQSAYVPPLPVTQGSQRGGAGSMPPDVHVQPPTNVQGPMSYVPGQYTQQSQPGLMVQHGTPHPPGFPHGQAIYFNHNAFPDFGNGGLVEQPSNFGMRPWSNDRPPHTGRGGFRRPSQDQASRGGKYARGNSMRGRGRGRDSFHSDERPSFATGPKNAQRVSNENSNADADTISYPKGRRGSMNANNWRSNSERPQALPNMPQMKENVAPGISYTQHQTIDHHYAPFQPPQVRDDAGPLLYRPDQVTMRPPYGFHPHSTVPDRSVSKKYPAPGGEHRRWRPPAMQCKPDSIGPDAYFATKLVLFGAPRDYPIEDLWSFLSQYAPIGDVNRGDPSVPVEYKHPLVFIYFPTHDDARHFLASKPEKWPNSGQPLKIEVAKEYWDEHHPRYGHYGLAVGGPRPYRDPHPSFRAPMRNRNEGVPTVLRRMEQQEAVPTPVNVSQVDRNVGTQSTDTTPTPSGTNTPKKRKTKSKGKKKADDLRKASLAAAADLAQTVEPSDQNNNDSSGSFTTGHGAVDPTTLAVQDNSTLKATVGPEIAEANPVPKTVEPTFEPETEEAIFASAAALGWGEFQNERSMSVETEVQTSQELPFPSAAASQTLLPFRPFQADEATPEEEAQATDVGITAGTAPRENLNSAEAPPESSTKIDDEQVEDSFHTASGSPGCAKQVTGLERTVTGSSSSTVTEQQRLNKATPDAQVGRKADSSSIASSEGTVSPQTVKKVPVPEISYKPKVTIAATDTEPKTEPREPRSTSGDTLVPSTPAFVTAPTTPYVGIEQSTQKEPVAEALKSEIAQAKKVERPKGPAQTQSFSQFGKKNEKKKTKSGKKDTLQGKPSSRTISDSSSRAVSGATTPNIDTTAQPERGRQRSKGFKEKMSTSQSRNSRYDDKLKQASQDTNRMPEEDTAVSQQETPSKRGGKLGSFASAFTGLFTGGQQSRPSSDTRSNSAASIKNLLTGSKAPDRLPSIDSQLNEPTSSSLSDIDIAEQSKASPEPVVATSQIQSDSRVTNDTSPASNTEHDEQHSVGLGISNHAEDSAIEGGRSGNKKTAKPKKKKKPKSPAKELQINLQIPFEAKSEDLTDVFRFGESSSSPHMMTATIDDLDSNASSHTVGPDTPTSENASPQSPRKLPPRSTAISHLMEAKQPSWKHNKKRIASRNIQDDSDDTTGGTLTISRIPAASPSGMSPGGNGLLKSEMGPKKEKIYIYVGAPLRDQLTDEQPEIGVAQSGEKLEALAIEELKRKHDKQT